MERAEAIEQLQNCKDLIKQDGQDYLDERDFPLLDMAIEALSKPNYETDTEVRLAVTNRKKEKVILWDAFGEVEYYPHGDMYCPNCGVRLVPENEYLEPTQTHGRLIDADTLSKKLCETTLFVKDGEVFQRMINDAPTVPVVDITQRDLCADISCTDCPFMQETCKLMDYVAYADRPHGEWICKGDYAECSECGGSSGTQFDGVEPIPRITAFCPHCGADMRERRET